MKRIFLDANVLVSVLNKEYPLFSYSSRILSLAGKKNVPIKRTQSQTYLNFAEHEKRLMEMNFELFTSPVCLAIAFYFAEKKSGTQNALNKIHLLVSKINIADTDKKAVIMASRNKAIKDFEDGLEYYSAVNAGCECLITENTGDFYFSQIKVMHCQQFLEQFLLI